MAPGGGVPAARVAHDRDQQAVRVGGEEPLDPVELHRQPRREADHRLLGAAVEVVVVEPGVEVRGEVRVEHLTLGGRAGRAALEDRALELEREDEREDVRVTLLAQLGQVLDEARLDPLREQRLVQRREPRLGRAEVEGRPVPLVRLADADLVRVRMHFGVAVEELAEQRPARALDLRDQHERLMHRHQLVHPRLHQRLVLLELGQALPGGAGPVDLEPPERRPREEGLGDQQVVRVGALCAGRPGRLPGEHGEVGLDAVRAFVRAGPGERRELEQTVLDAQAGVLAGELGASGQHELRVESLRACGRFGAGADPRVPGLALRRARHVEPLPQADVRGLGPAEERDPVEELADLVSGPGPRDDRRIAAREPVDRSPQLDGRALLALLLTLLAVGREPRGEPADERRVRRLALRRRGGPGAELLDRIREQRRRGPVEPERPDEAPQEPLVPPVVALAAERGLQLRRVLVPGAPDVQEPELVRLQVAEVQGALLCL